MKQNLSYFCTPEVEQGFGHIETKHSQTTKDPLITGLVYDSRKVEPGNLYFALYGLHNNGHNFIDSAIEKGAVVIVHQDDLSSYNPDITYIKVKNSRFAMSPIADAFYSSPSKHLLIIGVTGTEGKSTTVYLIYQLLKLAGKKAGFISTVQYDNGLGEMWNPEHQTTPEALRIHQFLKEAQDNGVEYVVLESSSHGLSEKTNRLGDVVFDVGVMTNVAHEHLEFHGTWEKYRDDKTNLFHALDKFSHEKKQHSETIAVPTFGVVNADDPSSTHFANATKHITYTYSTHGTDADIILQKIEGSMTGNWYEVFIRKNKEMVTVRDKLPGTFNAGNVLASLLTVSQLISKPIIELVPLVLYLKPVRGRMNTIQRGQDFEVMVDYAHTPSSFATIFPPIKERMQKKGGRIISVFGSAGERDTKKRSEQGRIAGEYSDIIVLTDEDPRSEIPIDILEQIAEGIPDWKKEENLFLIPDRPTAIRKAFLLAKSGDLVLLLGKGHENSIIYAHKTIPFDEITEAEKALAEMGFC